MTNEACRSLRELVAGRWTVPGLAAELGVGDSTVGLWLSGVIPIPWGMVDRLATLLEVEAADIRATLTQTPLMPRAGHAADGEMIKHLGRTDRKAYAAHLQRQLDDASHLVTLTRGEAHAVMALLEELAGSLVRERLGSLAQDLSDRIRGRLQAPVTS